MPTQNNTGDTNNPDRNNPDEPVGNLAAPGAKRDKKRRPGRGSHDKKK